jgi:hypothetical protein
MNYNSQQHTSDIPWEIAKIEKTKRCRKISASRDTKGKKGAPPRQRTRTLGFADENHGVPFKLGSGPWRSGRSFWYTKAEKKTRPDMLGPMPADHEVLLVEAARVG